MVVTSVALALMMTGGSVMPVRAAANATLTFTDGQNLEYTGTTANDDGSINLGNSFQKVAPGETREETITLKNDNNRTVDFYMSTEVLQTLEDAGKAAGAGYDISLMAGGTSIYNSTLGGYSADGSTSSTTGIGEINEELKGNILVATLSAGQSADVVLTIGFDGEAMDNNSQGVDYSNTLGKIAFDFTAGYEDPTGITREYKYVTRSGKTNYIRRVVEIIEERTPLAAVATGDGAMLGVAAAVLAAGVFLIFAAGRRKKAEEQS